MNELKSGKSGDISTRELKKRLAILPSSLDIYVTNRCNLDCKYCQSRVLNREKEKTLSFDSLTRAVDLFASYANPKVCKLAGGDPASVRTVCLTGGEPFLEFGLIARIVDYIRRNCDWFGIYIFTNGTILDREKVQFLLDRNVDIVISLDGGREVMDYHRKFQLDKAASVFDIVTGNMKKLSGKQINCVHLMATFTSETISSLTESLDFLRGFHCRDIHLGLDLNEIWTPENLKLLRKTLAGFKKHCVNIARRGLWNRKTGEVFNAYFHDKLSACQDHTLSNSFCLSPDGYFFPCDELSISAAGRNEYMVGDLEHGVDFARLEKTYSELSDYIARYDYVNGVLSPIDRYYHALVNGLDPVMMLKNGGKVSRIFMDELSGFIDAERILNNISKVPSFGDFHHEPKYRSAKGMAKFRIEITSSLAGRLHLGKARQAVDYFIYSPGNKKELVITGQRACEAGVADNFDIVETLGVYSVLKARHLGKSLRVVVEGNIEGMKRRHLEFMREHRIYLGVHDAGQRRI